MIGSGPAACQCHSPISVSLPRGLFGSGSQPGPLATKDQSLIRSTSSKSSVITSLE